MPRDNRPIDMESYRGNREKQVNRQKQPQNFFTYLIIAVFFVIIIVYVGNAVMSYMDSPEISIGTITMGEIDLPDIVDGIIIRDEEVYTSTSSGIASFNLNEGERVKSEGIVCVVVDAQTEAILAESIANIEAELFNVQSMRSDLLVDSQEVEQKNKQIKKMIEAGVPKLLTAGVSAVYEFKDSLSQTIDLRNQLILGEGNGSARGLAENRTAFDEKLKNAKDVIKANSSGIVSYLVDGLEETFTFETMESLLPEQVRFSADYSTIKAAYEVQPGDSLFKVARSNEWYIASYMSNDQITDWETEDDQIIYIENANKSGIFTPLEMRIAKIVKGEKTSYVLLKCNKYMTEYLNTRNVRFKMSKDGYSGYKIPKQAIIDKTVLKVPSEYVFDNDEGYFVMKRVNGVDSLVSVSLAEEYDPEQPVLYVNQDFEGLKLGDIIVKGGETPETFSVTEVDNIRGIYKANKGYTEFFKIYIDEYTQESGGFYILDPASNAGLNISDRIILDARNVKDRQILN